MCTLVQKLSNGSDYFLRLSRFPDLFGKVFLITFKFSFFDFSTTFSQERCNENSLISFFIIDRLKRLYVTITLFKLKFIFFLHEF